MRKTLLKALWFCGVLAISGATYAGLTSHDPVVIFTDPGTGMPAARGSLHDARNSTDPVMYLGCDRYVRNNSPGYAVCYARDATGNTVACYAMDPGMMQAIETVNAASEVDFAVNEDGFTCDSLMTVVGSFHL